MPTISELREKTQQGKLSKKFLLSFGYSFHRNISVYITWILLKVFPNIRSQYVSLSMILVGLAGTYCIFQNTLSYGVIGFVLIYSSFLLDKVDGEIARYKNIRTLDGVYLDELYHVLVPAALFFVVFYQFIVDGNSAEKVAVIILIWFSTLNRYSRKSIYSVYVKMYKYIQSGTIERKKHGNYVRMFWNFPLFRFSGILERFDLIVLVLFVAFVFEKTYQISYLTYTLFIFAALFVIQFLRGAFLMYFGRIWEEVDRLKEKGY